MDRVWVRADTYGGEVGGVAGCTSQLVMSISLRRRRRLSASALVLAVAGLTPLLTSSLSSAGTISFNAGPRPTIDGVYYHLAAGDFDGDARCDVLLYGPSWLPDAVRRGRSDGTFGNVALTVAGTYEAVVAGDFDGDGKADVLYYGRGSKTDVLRRGRAGATFAAGPSVSFNGSYDAVVAGDWNGDGRDDLFFYARGSAGDAIRLGTPTGFTYGSSVRIDGSYSQVVPGDYDGDGRDDLLLYGPGGRGDRLLLGTSGGGFKAGAALWITGQYHRIIAGDWNGDGRDDVLRFDARGDDSVRYAKSGAEPFGDAITVDKDGFLAPASCDYNGDGYHDVLWYGPSTIPDSLWLGRKPGTTRIDPTTTTTRPPTTTTRPPTTTTRPPTTTTTSQPPPDNTASRLCGANQPVSQGTVASNALIEISGVVPSRDHSGILWVHNDSGDSPRVYAMTASGASRGVYPLSGANAYDWEAIALGPGPSAGVDYLYVGDIGDNSGNRSEIQVYRVREPNPTTSGATLNGVERLRLRYPDGARDAEALMVDPQNGDLYIVSKTMTGESRVYRAAGIVGAGPTTMQFVRQLSLGASRQVTAGDISPNGQAVILRTYTRVHVFGRPAGQPLSAAFSRTPCEPPAPSEGQGEAIGVDADNGGFVTISEGSHEPIFHANA